MQIADTIMTVIRSRGERGCSSIMGDHKDREHMRRERETLESRMMRKYQVRFGGGLMEKGPQGNLASFLPDQERYAAELKDDKEALHLLKQKGEEGTVTLVYASHDEEHNGALVLKEYLEHHRS
jgi:Protein of unknown function, DUF488